MAIAPDLQLIERFGLKHTDPQDLPLVRRKQGKSFSFVDSRTGRPVSARRRAALRSLAIPPAWSDVKAAADERSHLQAVGRDDAGRLQYIYHPDWEGVRAVVKAERLLVFGRALPKLREAIEQDLRNPTHNLPLAAAARLVDKALLRAGHEAYAGEEGGRGAATLLKRHVKVEPPDISLRFRGKGGKQIEKRISDPELAQALLVLMNRPGRRLFQLDGVTVNKRVMTAKDLNQYLAEKSGQPITAKDFRTFFASAQALESLCAQIAPNKAARKRCVVAAAKAVSEVLVNTPTIVRKSYIMADVLDLFERGEMTRDTSRTRKGLSESEARLMRFLEERLGRRPRRRSTSQAQAAELALQ